MSNRIIQVRPLSGFRLHLRFADGLEGDVDLSDLAGRGVFSIWNDRQTFERVRIGTGGELIWGDQADLCADAMYLRIKAASPMTASNQ